jgi:hypothetical protein
VVKNSFKNTEARSTHLFQRGHGSIDESTNIPRQLILHIHKIVDWIQQFFTATATASGSTRTTAWSTGAAINQSGGRGGHLLP